MKLKYVLAALSFFSLSLYSSVAQKKDESGDVNGDRQIKGVLIGGINLTQVDGDEIYGFHKVGANVGFGGILPLGHHFSLSVEVLFDQKGSYRKFPPQSDSLSHVPYYSLKLDYLKAPIMIHYEDRNTWTFGLGFSWGRLVNYKEIEHNSLKTWERPDTITYKTKNDFNIIADIRFRIWKHLKMNVQYSYSLFKIRSRYFNPDPGRVDGWARNQYNNTISIRLLYYFNEKYMPPRFQFHKKKKEKKTE